MRLKSKTVLKFLFLITLIIIATLQLLDTINQYSNNSRGQNFQNILEFSGMLVLIFNFIVNNINFIFELYEKCKVYILNPTVNWKIQTIFSVESFEEDSMSRLFDKIKKETDEFSFPHYQKSFSNEYKIRLYNKDYIISVEPIEFDDNYEIRFIHEYQISYRESLKDFDKNYKMLEEKIKSVFSNTDDINYLLSITFDDFNPFYKIYLKKYDDMESIDFNMEYEVEDCQIIVTNNKITVASKFLDSVMKISKKYIAISNQNLFK
ncbi:hypothetical protein ACV7JQ_07220 [Globicatella sulfidifaciens]